MKGWEKAVVEGAIAILVRMHVQLCKECKKKYQEIEKHMQECTEDARKKEDSHKN